MATVVLRLVDDDDGTVGVRVEFDPEFNFREPDGATPAQRLGIYAVNAISDDTLAEVEITNIEGSPRRNEPEPELVEALVEAHAQGYHDDAPREFCPGCDRTRNRTG